LGFLRRFAQQQDFNQRKREAMTRYYEKSSTLRYMKSKQGSEFHSEQDVLEQEALLERMKIALKDQFEVTM
jgi:hypothetical protein